MDRFRLQSMLILLLLVIGGPAAASGATSEVSIPATERGWVSGSGMVQNTIGNYLARETGPGEKNHNYFRFDLSTIPGEITDARLELYNPSNGIDPGGNGVYSVFGGVFINGNSFDDIVSGSFYGSQSFTVADNDSVIVVQLNQAFIDQVHASPGSILIGGQVSNTHLFGYTTYETVPLSDTKLVLTVVPEPSSILLACGLGFVMLRRVPGVAR